MSKCQLYAKGKKIYPVTKGENIIMNDGSSLSSQLDTKANYNTVWNMVNMGQDVKEAMTGGSVAVVGKNTVLTENIVDRQVTRCKTSFYSISKNGNLIEIGRAHV